MKLSLFVLLMSCARGGISPLWFEPNEGQAHSSVHFLSRSIYLGEGRVAIHTTDSEPVVMTFVGARKGSFAEGLDLQPGITSYFLGNDPVKWRTGVPHYAKVRYPDIYPGIDVIFYGNAEGQLEYDFVVGPEAAPNEIKLEWNRPVKEDENGDLVIGGVRQKRPKVYQNGREISCDYQLLGSDRVQLALASYDRSQPLTIDPVLLYSSLLGGPAADAGIGIQTDKQGNAYLTGTSRAPVTPGLNPFQQAAGSNQVAFAIKMAPSLSSLIYYVFIGGESDDQGAAIAVDSTGAAIVTGQTSSSMFPAKNAIQSQLGGGLYDAFVTKVSPDGRSLVYSTFLGGTNWDQGNAIVVDSAGNAYAGGWTYGLGFPVKNALQPAVAGAFDGFVTKISPVGALLFSTFLGGSSFDTVTGLALDAAGSLYVTGGTSSADFPVAGGAKPFGNSLGYVMKLTPTGDSLVYSRLIGCSPQGIAVDSVGNLIIGGGVSNEGLPLKNAIQTNYGGGGLYGGDGCVLKLTPDASDVIFSTYLGGSGADGVYGPMVLDPAGNIYMTGVSRSPDFPVKNPIQKFNAGIPSGSSLVGDAFLTVLSPTGGLVFSTWLGGGNVDLGAGVALDPAGNIVIFGTAWSSDFPIAGNAIQSAFGGGQSDMFLSKISAVVAQVSPFTANPEILHFQYVLGGSSPAYQTVSVTSTPTGSPFTPQSNVSWLRVTSSNQTTPATLAVSIDPSGLTAGGYSGIIQVDALTSVQVNLAVQNPAPILASISPSVVPVGASATTLTITGSGFVSGSTVYYGTASLTTGVVVLDGNTIQVTLPKTYFSTALVASFQVQNPLSALSNALSITVGTPAPQIAAVTNAATFKTGPVAPGEIVTLFGTSLIGTVTFDGTPATLVYSSATQVSVTVPYTVAGSSTTVQVGSAAVQLPVAPSSPGVFAAVSSGNGIVTLYATGGGVLSNDPLPVVTQPTSVIVNGTPVQVLYAGVAPGLIEGANQINIQLLPTIRSGVLSMVWKVGDVSSPAFSLQMPPNP